MEDCGMKSSVAKFNLLLLCGVLYACSAPIETNVRGPVDTTLSQEGTVSREVSAETGDLIIETTMQKKQANVVISAQTFSTHSVITVQEGKSLINDDSDVGKLIVTSVFSSAPTIIISNSKQENPNKPMNVSLPLPEEAVAQSLDLVGVLEDPLANLIVVYKVIDFKSGNIVKTGFYTKDKLTIVDKFVAFSTAFLGAYQAIVTIDHLDQSVERIARTPILNKSNEVVVTNPLQNKEAFLPDKIFENNARADELKVFNASLSKDLRVGEIKLSITLGSFYDITYEKLSIRRLKGVEAPHSDCQSDGEVIAEWDSFPSPDITFFDQTGSLSGEAFSYRACIYSVNKQITSSNVITKIRAFDNTPPPAATGFRGRSGGEQGEIILSIEWPQDRSDYDRVEVRAVKGARPPDASCKSPNDKIVGAPSLLTRFYSLAYVADSTIGELYTYRLCIWDALGNLTASNIVSAQAFDELAPPPLLSLAGITGKPGDIELSWGLPTDTSDYALIKIAARASLTPPAEGCTEGIRVANFTAPFPTRYTFATESLGQEFSIRVCIEDRSGNRTSLNTLSGIKSGGTPPSPIDITPPPALARFLAQTGSARDGDIELLLQWPDDVSDYANVSVLRSAGSGAPSSPCRAGVVVASWNTFKAGGFVTFADATGSGTGQAFSYRVCITDRAGNLRASDTAVGIRARDTQAPYRLVDFSARKGSEHGDIDLSLSLPGDLADYSTLFIRRKAGATAPHFDCERDGFTIQTILSFASGQVLSITDKPSSANPPEPFSYRVCIEDASGNLQSSDALANVTPRDKQGPPALVAFESVSTQVLGDVKLAIDFPDSHADYQEAVIRRVEGSAPPFDCSSGDEIASYTSFSDVLVKQALVPGQVYSYRACLFDAEQNETSTDTAIVTANDTAVHRIFLSSYLYDANLGGMSGADAKCQAVAALAQGGEGLGGRWRAILSDESTDARDHIDIVSGAPAIVNMQGLPFALNEEELWSRDFKFRDDSIEPVVRTFFDDEGDYLKVKVWMTYDALLGDYDEIWELLNFLYEADIRWKIRPHVRLSYDENGDFLKVRAWTGSSRDGTRLDRRTCESWTNGTESAKGRVGNPWSRSGMTWLARTSKPCNNTLALYCIDGQR